MFLANSDIAAFNLPPIHLHLHHSRYEKSSAIISYHCSFPAMCSLQCTSGTCRLHLVCVKDKPKVWCRRAQSSYQSARRARRKPRKFDYFYSLHLRHRHRHQQVVLGNRASGTKLCRRRAAMCKKINSTWSRRTGLTRTIKKLNSFWYRWHSDTPPHYTTHLLPGIFLRVASHSLQQKYFRRFVLLSFRLQALHIVFFPAARQCHHGDLKLGLTNIANTVILAL